jgi:hypothetical protein
MAPVTNAVAVSNVAIQRAREGLRATPRRWLVTGSVGFIGSHLVQELPHGDRLGGDLCIRRKIDAVDQRRDGASVGSRVDRDVDVGSGDRGPQRSQQRRCRDVPTRSACIHQPMVPAREIRSTV